MNFLAHLLRLSVCIPHFIDCTLRFFRPHVPRYISVFGGVSLLVRLIFYFIVRHHAKKLAPVLFRSSAGEHTAKLIYRATNEKALERSIRYIYLLFESTLFGIIIPYILFRAPAPEKVEIFQGTVCIWLLWSALNTHPFICCFRDNSLGKPYVSILTALFVIGNLILSNPPAINIPLSILAWSVFYAELILRFAFLVKRTS